MKQLNSIMSEIEELADYKIPLVKLYKLEAQIAEYALNVVNNKTMQEEARSSIDYNAKMEMK